MYKKKKKKKKKAIDYIPLADSPVRDGRKSPKSQAYSHITVRRMHSDSVRCRNKPDRLG
jgi:hypothetical protein